MVFSYTLVVFNPLKRIKMTYEQQINEEWTRSIFGSLEQAEEFIDEYLYERELQGKKPVLMPLSAY